MRSLKLDRSLAIAIALVCVVCALTYLPALLQATIFRDDWYYVMDRLIGGPGVFPAMFSIDRPARGPFFELYYQMFGIAPLPYHLASFAWRLLGGLASLWFFQLLWPAHRRAGMWMAVLFVLFPGYLRWMEGFEDQPRIASLCLEVLSIALTLKAVSAATELRRVAYWSASILTGWAYLALVDFGIGMEAFRLLCVGIALGGSVAPMPLFKRLLAVLRVWLPAMLIPLGFLTWRLLVFHNERVQTDVGRQLGALISAPLATAPQWLLRFLQSAADVAAFSWVTPVLQGFFNLRLRELIPGAALALLVAAAFYLADRWIQPDPSSVGEPAGSSWTLQAMTIGLVGVCAGVLPVVAANRFVNFDAYSHYALPASLAASVFLGGLLFTFRHARTAMLMAAFLAGCAVIAHYTYSLGALQEEAAVSMLWRQVAWRAPAISPQTTLYASYPGAGYGENIDAIQGPGNFIYFRQPTGQIPVTYPLYALPHTPQAVTVVLAGTGGPTGYRTHQGFIDPDRLLVLTQPTSSSCVHAIDAQVPLFSSNDAAEVRVLGAFSRTTSILNGSGSPALPEMIFGREPPHRWCYYFEKADLALQFGDWQRVAALGEQAAAAGLGADDPVEWTPFLQAYAHVGDSARFTETAHVLAADPAARRQACSALLRMQAAGAVFRPDIQSKIGKLICMDD